MNIKELAAHIISIVFQPLLMPLFGTVYLVYANPFTFPDEYQNFMMMLRVGLLTFFFPAVAVGLLAALKFISTISLRERQDRIIPYIITMAMYIWAFFVFFKEGFNGVVTFLLLAATISIVLAFLINILFLKVSMHTTAAGGMIAFFMLLIPYSQFNSLWPFIITILIAGAIGTSRLILKAHSTREVYYGYMTGFFSFMIAYNIFHF
jgi:membrane-associated phospholipid phosphatase